ncbi:MAG: YicC family protein [Ignavibacteriales bacterium]|nr:YicC family protein [Ignavibacteriales bacterium]
MTGFGSGEVSAQNITARAEIRSVNSRFFEVNIRLPRSLATKENDVKEIIRQKISRGKITLNISLEHNSGNEIPLKVNLIAAKAYANLLSELKENLQLKEDITLNHILKFSEVLEAEETVSLDEEEWKVTEQAMNIALREFQDMRTKEGSALKNDMLQRVRFLENSITEIENLSKERRELVRQQFQKRIEELLSDRSIVDERRLEFEISLLVDRLDITEECVRFLSHMNYFRTLVEGKEPVGRPLNFLLQEINREINTIGSKANDATIAKSVVTVKEELEKIREQLQNIE